MANKSKKTNEKNKNLIVGICAALVVVIIVVVAVVLIANNTGINDSYFVSDGSKYVLTIENEEDSDEDPYTPAKTHIVYTYSGDAITGLKSYYEYKDADAAKAALDYIKQEMGEDAGQIELNGKYIVITSPEDQYKDLTAADVKEQIDFMNSLKDMNIDDLEDTDDGEVVEDVETETEVEE